MKEYNFNLTKLPLDDETELGVSHILGCPDVPEKWNEEAVFFNDEVFLGQFNLSEFNIEGLPTDGMLYFFFASGSKPYRGIVRCTKDLTNLERIDFNSEVEYPMDLNKEYSLKQADEGLISLFPNNCKLKNYKLKKDEIVLFRFKDIPSLDLNVFGNEDDVCFVIKKDDLEKGLFEKAFLANSLE